MFAFHIACCFCIAILSFLQIYPPATDNPLAIQINMTDNTKIGALEGRHPTFEPPNSRRTSGGRWVSDDGGIAPRPEIGPWRKEIGPTLCVGPLVLRLFGELALNRTGPRNSRHSDHRFSFLVGHFVAVGREHVADGVDRPLVFPDHLFECTFSHCL